ncbi:MAG: hypothetical protein AAF529_10350 [Pseudomonadota bacterium]
MRHNTNYLLLLVCGLLLAACQEPSPSKVAENSSPEQPTSQPELDEASLPPGFTDAPPPPPTSNTLVLSGGKLVLGGETIIDSVVVISDGLIKGWGKRGEVAMPNDSIGKDLRGKWLLPITSLQRDQTAAIDILDSAPAAGLIPAGQVRGTNVVLPVSND